MYEHSPNIAQECSLLIPESEKTDTEELHSLVVRDKILIKKMLVSATDSEGNFHTTLIL